MTAPKQGRQYRSSLRQEQARRTRGAVLDAATALFVTKGFGATTMKDVAAAAGVSVESVYAQGGKADLLLACVDRSLVGDDEAVPLLDRDEMRTVLESPDPETFLGALRAIATERLPAGAAIFEAFRSAAAVDARLAEQWRVYSARRYQDCARMIGALAPHLRPGLTVADATDTYWALLSPAVMLGLSGERGRSPQWYANWLTDSLRRLLF